MTRETSSRTLNLVVTKILALVVLAMATTAWAQYTETTLHSFSSFDAGYGPTALVSDSAGNLYGIAQGGVNRAGIVFKLAPSTSGPWKYHVLYSFTGENDGYIPSALTVDSAGNLYGTTVQGGKDLSGTVYELSPLNGGWKFNLLHAFTSRHDGAFPYGITLDGAGNVYVTADLGGKYEDPNCENGVVPNGCGTVIELSPSSSGWICKTLFAFNYYDGGYPQAGVTLDSAGNLYGTTVLGGNQAGLVFELTKASGWSESDVHAFVGPGDEGGANPDQSLIFDTSGNLYGTTPNGGTADAGVAFKLSPASGGPWTETVLYSFTGGDDGAGPSSGLIFDPSGNLYGATISGGASGAGTVYQLVFLGGGAGEGTLYSFTGGSDGANPYGNLVRDSAGNLYGAAESGGLNSCGGGCGVIFELSSGSSSAR